MKTIKKKKPIQKKLSASEKEQKHAGGRPPKFTEERKKKIFFAIEKSATYETAANFAGIRYQTLRNWIKKGEEQAIEAEKDESFQGDEYFEFFEQLKVHEGTGAIASLIKIDKAADEGSWQAAAWKLERRYPQQYGRTVQEHQGKGGGPIEFANLTPEERLNRVSEILESARARRASTSDNTSGEGS